MRRYNLYLMILILSLVATIFGARHHFTVNISDSLPKGVYWLTKAKGIKKGDIVLFNVPENAEKYIHGRKYLKKDVKKLLKKVAATEKDNIMRIDDKLYINREFHSYIKNKDSKGRELPYLSSDSLQPMTGELLVLGTHPSSFDSRYFGVIKKSEIENKAKLILKY